MSDLPNRHPSLTRPTRAVLLAILTSALVGIAPSVASAQDSEATPVSDEGDGNIAGEQPSGMWIGGGFSLLANGGAFAGMRAEFGIPLSEDIPLSLVIPLTFHGRRVNGIGGDSKFHIFTVLPALQYEFLLPLDIPGQITVVGELGLGFALARVKTDPNVGPTTKDADGAFGIHAAVIARYYFESVPELFVALQPAGVMAIIRNGGTGYYEFYAGMGYRFGQ